MLATGFGLFKILYAIGAIALGVDIYQWLTKRGQPGLKAFINTAIAVAVLVAVVELPFALIMTIPYVPYIVGALSVFLIGRAVIKVLRWNNRKTPAAPTAPTDPTKKS